MPKLELDRSILSKFLPNHAAIVAFERMLNEVGGSLPTTIEEANNNAGVAIAAAQSALSALVEIAAALEQLLTAPAPADTEGSDDTYPNLQVGTLAAQNHDAVDITGGRIGLDAGTVAAPSFYLGGEDTTGLYRVAANSWGLSIAGVKLATFSGLAAAFEQNVSTTKQLVSTVAAGTPPLSVVSTDLVPNLYVARAVLADTATYASSAGTAGSLGSPGSYAPDATDLATAITLVNAIKARNISRGV